MTDTQGLVDRCPVCGWPDKPGCLPGNCSHRPVDTQDLVERLRRDDDLVSRTEAAASIQSLQARVAELEAESTTAQEALKSWNNHFFSMTDGSNWPNDMKGDYFKGYSSAMEELHEYCLEMFDERAALARKDTP